MLLRRIKALVIKHRNGACNIAQRLGGHIAKGIGVSRIHHQSAHTQSATMSINRNAHHRLNRRIVYIVQQALSTGQVTFEQAINSRTEQLAHQTRIFGNTHAGVHRDFFVVHVVTHTPFLGIFHLRKNKHRIHVGNHRLQGSQHVGHGTVNIGIGAGPYLANLEGGLGFVRHATHVPEFRAQIRCDYRSRTGRTVPERNHRQRRCRRSTIGASQTRTVHAGKHKSHHRKRNQEKEHSSLERKANQ